MRPRRLAHLSFTLGSGISLALCAFLAVLWMWGGLKAARLHYNYGPAADQTRRTLYFSASSHGDTLTFEFNHRYFPPAYFQRLTSGQVAEFDKSYPTGFHGSLLYGMKSMYASWPGSGFRFQHSVNPQSGGWRSDYWRVSVPRWLAMLVLAVPAAWWLYHAILRPRLRARRAAREGLCPICGYDLRATPDRCPECGNSQVVGASNTL